MSRAPWAAWLLAALAACSATGNSDGQMYRIGFASGSLGSWTDTMTCVCSVDREAVSFSCGRSSDDPSLSFEVPRPKANLRTRAFAVMDVVSVWKSFQAASSARVEYELQSEDVVVTPHVDHPTVYRALVVHRLRFDDKRVCALDDASWCLDLPAGSLGDARFLCSESD